MIDPEVAAINQAVRARTRARQVERVEELLKKLDKQTARLDQLIEIMETNLMSEDNNRSKHDM